MIQHNKIKKKKKTGTVKIISLTVCRTISAKGQLHQKNVVLSGMLSLLRLIFLTYETQCVLF